MNAQAVSTIPKTTRNLWPLCIFGFLALVIISSVGFILFCSFHPSHLVAGDYYEQEVRYQQQINSLNRTRLLQDAASIRHEPRNSEIILSIPNSHAAANAIGRIHLYRPSDAAQDRVLPVQTDAQGHQTISTCELAPGLWKVRVSWTALGHDYVLEERITVGAGRAGTQ